jgi:hypothetical protein
MKRVTFGVVQRLAAVLIVILSGTAIFSTFGIFTILHRTVLTVIIPTLWAITVTAVFIRASDKTANLGRTTAKAYRRFRISCEACNGYFCQVHIQQCSLLFALWSRSPPVADVPSECIGDLHQPTGLSGRRIWSQTLCSYPDHRFGSLRVYAEDDLLPSCSVPPFRLEQEPCCRKFIAEQCDPGTPMTSSADRIGATATIAVNRK